MSIEIRFKALDEKAIIPVRGSKDAACWDLFALEDVDFGPGEIKLVKTGLACEVTPGYRTNIYVRSSTPLKKGFILANSVGIIDNDYRGDLGIQLMNVATTVGRTRDIDGLSRVVGFLTNNQIKRGDKIAQLEIVKDLANEVKCIVTTELNDTERGSDGFGSTGN